MSMSSNNAIELNNNYLVSIVSPEANTNPTLSRKVQSERPITGQLITEQNWAPCLVNNAYLTSINFKATSILAYDLDAAAGQLELTEAEALSKFSQYAVIIGHTKSSGIEKRGIVATRTRLIFRLSSPITDSATYKHNYITYANILGLSNYIDTSTQDTARYFAKCKSLIIDNPEGKLLEPLVLPPEPAAAKLALVVQGEELCNPGNIRASMSLNTRALVDDLECSESSRHQSFLKAVVQLKKKGCHSEDIIEVLTEPWHNLLSDRPISELTRMVEQWADNTVMAEPVFAETKVAKPKKVLKKATAKLLTDTKSTQYKGFKNDLFVAAIDDMFACNYTKAEITTELAPKFRLFRSEEPESVLLELIQTAFVASLPVEQEEIDVTPREGGVLNSNEVISALESGMHKYARIALDEKGNESYLALTTPTTVKPIVRKEFNKIAARVIREAGLIQNIIPVVHNSIECWMLNSKSCVIDELPPSFTLDKNELAFNYVNARFDQPGECPVFDNYVKRAGANGEALKAFTYAILNREDKSQIYMYISSNGRNGKGSYIDWLKHLLGKNCITTLKFQNKRWPAQCVGKRLGWFDDVVDSTFLMSQDLKSITGGAPAVIDEKNEAVYSTKLDTKFIVTSNEPLSLSGKKSDIERCLAIDLQPMDELVPFIDEVLIAETNAYLFKCKKAYEELYDPRFKKLKFSYEIAEEAAAEYEINYQLMYDTYFESKVLSTSTDKHDWDLKSTYFTEVIKTMPQKLDKFEILNFKNWLIRTGKMTKVVVNGIHYWRGIRTLEQTELQRRDSKAGSKIASKVGVK